VVKFIAKLIPAGSGVIGVAEILAQLPVNRPEEVKSQVKLLKVKGPLETVRPGVVIEVADANPDPKRAKEIPQAIDNKRFI
jgi:hypothetical protein